jgi:hypothetical protein
MNIEDFKASIESRISKSLDTLKFKNETYNPNEDKLEGFKVAGQLQSETAREALGGMMAKHVVSVYELIRKPELASPEVWDEKLGDNLNYLLLLSAVVEDERSQMQPATIDSRIEPNGRYRNPADLSLVYAGDAEHAKNLVNLGYVLDNN